jgi:hypothetical protein
MISEHAYLAAELFALGALDRFRSGEGGRSGGCVQNRIRPFELRADAQVGYLNMIVMAEQQVGWLDVAMNYPLEMNWGQKGIE